MRSPDSRAPGEQARGGARMPSGDDGFTMAEAVVSLVIFAMVAASSVTALTTATRTSKTSRERVAAANLALSDLELARSLQYPNYPTATSPHTVTVGSTVYTISRTVSNNCPATWTAGQPTSMQVTTTVTWSDLNGAGGSGNIARQVTEATVIAC